MPGRSTSSFHRPGKTLLAPSAKRREVLYESHEGWELLPAYDTKSRFGAFEGFEADFLAYQGGGEW